MNSEKVTVINSIGNVHVIVPDLKFSRSWGRKGSRVTIEKDLLAELMYDVGVDYMFKSGMLYIEDMPTKIELGLEPEGATEPVNIIVLNESQKKRYLTVLPVEEFKIKFKELSREQRIELANFAIENKLSDLAKDEIILKGIGIDVHRAIQLNEDAKLEDKE